MSEPRRLRERNHGRGRPARAVPSPLEQAKKAYSAKKRGIRTQLGARRRKTLELMGKLGSLSREQHDAVVTLTRHIAMVSPHEGVALAEAVLLMIDVAKSGKEIERKQLELVELIREYREELVADHEARGGGIPGAELVVELTDEADAILENIGTLHDDIPGMMRNQQPVQPDGVALQGADVPLDVAAQLGGGAVVGGAELGDHEVAALALALQEDVQQEPVEGSSGREVSQSQQSAGTLDPVGSLPRDAVVDGVLLDDGGVGQLQEMLGGVELGGAGEHK